MPYSYRQQTLTVIELHLLTHNVSDSEIDIDRAQSGDLVSESCETSEQNVLGLGK